MEIRAAEISEVISSRSPSTIGSWKSAKRRRSVLRGRYCAHYGSRQSSAGELLQFPHDIFGWC